MKTREEQIVEMAKEMRNYGYKHLYAGRVFYYGFSEHLYNAGYRKQNDVVREILKRITNYSLDFNYDLKYEVQKIAEEYGTEVEE